MIYPDRKSLSFSACFQIFKEQQIIAFRLIIIFKLTSGHFLRLFCKKRFKFYLLLARLNMMIGGDKRDRTADLLRARQALSQLSYIPNVITSLSSFHLLFSVDFSSPFRVVGLSGLEPPTSPLSGVRSNHLSYRPKRMFRSLSCLLPIKQSV